MQLKIFFNCNWTENAHGTWKKQRPSLYFRENQRGWAQVFPIMSTTLVWRCADGNECLWLSAIPPLWMAFTTRKAFTRKADQGMGYKRSCVQRGKVAHCYMGLLNKAHDVRPTYLTARIGDFFLLCSLYSRSYVGVPFMPQSGSLTQQHH